MSHQLIVVCVTGKVCRQVDAVGNADKWQGHWHAKIPSPGNLLQGLLTSHKAKNSHYLRIVALDFEMVTSGNRH